MWKRAELQSPQVKAHFTIRVCVKAAYVCLFIRVARFYFRFRGIIRRGLSYVTLAFVKLQHKAFFSLLFPKPPRWSHCVRRETRGTIERACEECRKWNWSDIRRLDEGNRRRQQQIITFPSFFWHSDGDLSREPATVRTLKTGERLQEQSEAALFSTTSSLLYTSFSCHSPNKNVLDYYSSPSIFTDFKKKV